MTRIRKPIDKLSPTDLELFLAEIAALSMEPDGEQFIGRTVTAVP